ncbi:MAG: DNA-binding protein [Lachnospiraceae bacterium]|nr:DNA-binding protein [Lachnospiraceae bacterium]
MKFDLYEVRVNHYDYTMKEFAKCAGIRENYYSNYEKRGEIPSKYIYNLWSRLPNFPIPSDFFYYTSTTLLVNMKYHHYSQEDIKELFNFKTQAVISKYINGKYPMYERKEYFRKAFQPLIIPFILKEENGHDEFYQVTDLIAKGNMDEDYAETRGKSKSKNS